MCSGRQGQEAPIHLRSDRKSYRIILSVQLGQGSLCTSTATSWPCALQGIFLCDLVSKESFFPNLASTETT